MSLVLSIALGLGVLGIALSGAAQGTASTRPAMPSSGLQKTAAKVRTLVHVRGRIGAFAQDGDRIAWVWPREDCTQLVQVRTLSTGSQRKVVPTHGPTCSGYFCCYVPSLALAGKRALWALSGASSQEDWFELVTASLGDRHDVSVGDLWGCCGRDGADRRTQALYQSIPMAGGGSTLVYVQADDPDSAAGDTPDRGVWRVDGRRSTRIPGLIGASAIAVSGERVAILSDTNETASGCACNAEASWSPSGARIAFSGQPEGDDRFSAIEVAANDGTGATKITNQTLGDYSADSQPDWSPDGSRIAFARADVSTSFLDPTVWTMNSDGTGQRKLTQGRDPAWSPDGTKIAFARNWPQYKGGIFVINSDGSGLRQLYSETDWMPEWSPHPDWSPDGTKLVFEMHNDPGEIRIMNADGTNNHRVAAGWQPSWSPDGSRIAFVGDGVRVMNVDGTNDHPVADGSEPSWFPDGNRLAITKEVGLGRDKDIFVVGANGGTETRLTTAKIEPIAPTLQLRNARTGKLIARVAYEGQGQAVAMSPDLVAVLARDDSGSHIALYDARDGSAAGIVPVAAGAQNLSIAGNRIVFRTGRQVWLLAARTMRVSLLTTAAAKPIGLSIEGRRVAWAENRGKKGARVRAINLSS